MKISDIIARIDDLKPNDYASATKLTWVNHVDGYVWNEIYKHTDFIDVEREEGVSAYDLPEGVNFEMVTNVYINGREIYPIKHGDIDTTGYYRDTDGKLNIYPVPEEDDTKPGLRIVYRVPFKEHKDTEEEAFILPPYDVAYDDYIAAMIDKYSQDMESYSNNVAFYNNSIDEYERWYRGEQNASGTR